MSRDNVIEKEFEELFKKNYSQLFYCAYDVVKDSETAKDIVNDVFSDTWADYARLRKERVEAYLFRSVRNRCIDYLRHEEIVLQYQAVFLEAGKEWENEEEEDFQEEDIAYMRRILSELPPRTRLIFEQCYFFGKKYKEVAAAMELSEAAIHKHMVKTFAVLREKFKERKLKR